MKRILLLITILMSFNLLADEVTTGNSVEVVKEIEETIELTEEIIEKEKFVEWKTIKDFNEEIDTKFEIEYTGELPKTKNYVIVISDRINMREQPTVKSEILSKANYGERLEVLKKVETDEDKQWYKVKRDEKEYFVYSGIVLLREFRFEKMEENIDVLENFIESNLEKGLEIGSVEAYAPNKSVEEYERGKDKYGNVLDQSAIGKYDGEEIYVADRTIVALKEKVNGRYKVEKIGGDEPYLSISKERITKKPNIEKMPEKAIVIDIKNQNFGVFEKKDGEWKVISYAYSKTGRISGLGFETPKGNFIVPMAKQKMLYADAEGEIQGFAMNAIRFSGGGYIHGTPFNNDEVEDYENKKRAKESTLGMFSGTRKCVRNTVEHSEFIFNWVLNDEIVKSKNIQKVPENVVVIVI